MGKSRRSSASISRRLLTAMAVMGAAFCLLVCPTANAAESKGEYGDSYTSGELEALATAMRAGNMTLADLQFDKDYAQGYACYTSIRHMMDDPLYIASFMDNMAAGAQVSGPDLLRLMVNADSLAREAHNSDWTASEPRPAPASLEELIALISTVAGIPAAPLTEAEHDLLRRGIVKAMAWHDVEKGFRDEAAEAADSAATEDAEELYKLMGRAQAHPDMIYAELFNLRDSLLAMGPDSEIFPRDKVRVIQTEMGQMALGTPGDDYYSGDFAILIDPAGNDTYHNCRIGAAFGQRSYGPRLADGLEATGASADFSPLGNGRFGFFLDMAGDDLYDCADVDITLGAAVLGTGLFYDLGGGDDRYFAGSVSLGAAMCGIATFYDDGGSDSYSGKTYTQGAAGFGYGIMLDDSQGDTPEFDIAEGNETEIDSHERQPHVSPDVLSLVDNDSYTAWSEAQAFARTSGVALCINTRGNEVYEAGGVYLHAPLFGDRYQSFSQGFAIGERDIDYAGGIAMLIDQAGNDRYLGDIYNQGVGYWYSGGFLWDGAGNDMYEMTQYGQGSGIHLAVGGLVDVSGTDSYIMHSGLGQGGSHDFAASIFHDRGGDDRYFGNTSCNGCGLTNSVGIHIDREGNDTYASRKDGGLNSGRPARDTASIGVLVDMGGTDSYLADGGQADSSMWSNSRYGMGWDIAPPPEAEETTNTSGPNQPPGDDVELPEIIAYEGELTQKVFDELWEIAIRWEVGENVAIVPKARERIIAFGLPVLPFVVNEMEDDYSLAVRAFNEIYPQLMELDREAVLDALRVASQSDVYTQRNCVLRVIGDLKITELSDVVIDYFEDPLLSRRAIGVIGMIGSHEADAVLIERLSAAAVAPVTGTETDEKDLIATIISACNLQLSDAGPSLSMLLSYPSVTVRDAVVGKLAAEPEFFDPLSDNFWKIHTFLEQGSNDDAVQREAVTTALRCLLEIHRRRDAAPTLPGLGYLSTALESADWGLRGDAVRLLLHWQAMELDGDLRTAVDGLYSQTANRMATEAHPFVLNVWSRQD